MSSNEFHLFVLFLAGVLLWQLISGKALGAWWYPRITREESPKTYWFVLAVQGAILAGILTNGTATWNFR
jgi:hypothetical protein